MVYPGGWRDLEISAPRPIKPIIAQVFIDAGGGGTIQGEIVNSVVFYDPQPGGWAANPFTINAEPRVSAVNGSYFVDELYRADAMNAQTQMANLTDAPPAMSNNIYLYGNKNGELKYQMQIDINLGANNYPWLELSCLENAATDGGPNGVVQAFRFDNPTNFTGVVSMFIMFDNYFGPINLGLRASDTVPNESIMPLYCTILNADPR